MSAYPLDRAPEELKRGDLVVARNRKFNGKAHWVVPGKYLGSDDFGHWIYQGAGSFVSRPDAAFFAESDAVLLVPHQGDWVATYYNPPKPSNTRIYVDLAAELGWKRIRPTTYEFHMIDMDLDVIQRGNGQSFIDDEDEFLAHSAQMNYPRELIEATEAQCAQIFEAVSSGQKPFDGHDLAWINLGRELQ